MMTQFIIIFLHHTHRSFAVFLGRSSHHLVEKIASALFLAEDRKISFSQEELQAFDPSQTRILSILVPPKMTLALPYFRQSSLAKEG